MDADLCKRSQSTIASQAGPLVAENRSSQICERTEIRRLLEQSLAAKRRFRRTTLLQLGYSNDGYIQQRFPAWFVRSGKDCSTENCTPRGNEDGLVEALREVLSDTRRASKAARCVSTDTLRSHFPDLIAVFGHASASHVSSGCGTEKSTSVCA